MASGHVKEGQAAGLPAPSLRAALASCFGFSVVTNLLMLTVPVYMMHVYDGVLATGSVETLIALTALALGLLAVLALVDAMRGRVLARTALKTERDLAPELLRRELDEAAEGRGEAPAKASDLATMRSFFAGPSVTAFFDAPLIPVFLLIEFLLHPVLGVVGICATLVLAGFAVANDLLARRRSAEVSERGGAARRWYELGRGNAEAVDGLGMAPRLVERWCGEFFASQAAHLRLSERGGGLVAASKAFRLGVQVAVLAAGAALVLAGEITPGVMLASSFIMARALAPVEQAIAGWRQARGAIAAWRRVVKALKRPRRRTVGTSLPIPQGRLEVENLTFTPAGAEQPTVKDVSFRIEPGSVLAVVGASASGKSTLARLLVGVLRPDSGHARLDGMDVFNWSREEVSDHIGYLPQSVDLVGATVADAISRLAPGDEKAIVEAGQQARAHDMILRLPQGYDTVIEGNGGRLSGGQRQRIGLARAVYGNPRLVVLDEANSNLDGHGEAALAETIASLKAEGVTVVAIGHRASTLAQADQVAVLEEGRLVAFGDPKEVFRSMWGGEARRRGSAVVGMVGDRANKEIDDARQSA